METIIVAILSIALMVVGGMTMSRGFISTAESASAGIKQLQANNAQILRTDLAVENGSLSTSGDVITFMIKNTGQTKLYDYTKWDFIVQYTDAYGQAYSMWLPYSVNGLSANVWSIGGLYIDVAQNLTEQFDPGILDPSEEMVLSAQLSPPAGDTSAVQVTLSTSNGIQVSTILKRQP